MRAQNKCKDLVFANLDEFIPTVDSKLTVNMFPELDNVQNLCLSVCLL